MARRLLIPVLSSLVSDEGLCNLASLSLRSLAYLHISFRICAGAHYAEAALYITIVSILSTFNISKCKDENGVEIEPSIGFKLSLAKYVLRLLRKCRRKLTISSSILEPFDCDIQPRTSQAADLVRGSS